MRHHFQLHSCSSKRSSVARVKKDGTMLTKCKYSEIPVFWNELDIPIALVAVSPNIAGKSLISSCCKTPMLHFLLPLRMWEMEAEQDSLAPPWQQAVQYLHTFWNTTFCFHREGWASTSQDREQLLNQRLITQGCSFGTTHYILKLF